MLGVWKYSRRALRIALLARPLTGGSFTKTTNSVSPIFSIFSS